MGSKSRLYAFKRFLVNDLFSNYNSDFKECGPKVDLMPLKESWSMTCLLSKWRRSFGIIQFIYYSFELVKVAWSNFWFSSLSVFGQGKNIDLCQKKISHKWMAFEFGNTYIHQTFTECVSNRYTYFDMLDVTASYGRSFEFIAIFGYFHTLLMSIHV